MKYPQYGDIADAMLIQRIVAKYPEYADAFKGEPTPTEHPSILTKQFGRELGRTLTTPEGYLNISKTALDVGAAPFAVADWALRNPVVNVQFPWAEPLAKAAAFPFQKIGEAMAGTLPENASPFAQKLNEINQGLAQFAAGAAVGGVAGEVRPRTLPKTEVVVKAKPATPVERPVNANVAAVERMTKEGKSQEEIATALGIRIPKQKPPASPEIAKARETLKEAGLEPIGEQMGLILFNHPKTQSTLTLPIKEVTRESIAAKLAEHEAKFKKPVSPVGEKPEEPTSFGSGLGNIYPMLERGVREFMGRIPEKPAELPKHITPAIITEVTTALKDAKILRGETEKLYHQAKQKQVGVLARIQSAEPGEAGYYQQLAALKGELPKPEFESIRGKMPQETRDAMHRAIQASEKIGVWERVVGGRALDKLFGERGVQIPTEGEITILEDVFGKGLAEALVRKSSLSRKLRRVAIDVLALPQTLLASFDQSMVLRQAVIQSFRHPGKAIQNIGKSTKAMFSETAYREIRDKIAKDPDAKLAKQTGLYILDPDRAIVKLEQLEERFISRIARWIPGVRASERAAYTYLNTMRLDVFKDYKGALDRIGVDVNERPELYKWAVRWINSTTGRGSYGSFNRHAPTASLLLWSPRLLKSRIDLLRPSTYIKMPKELRVKAWGDLAAFVGPTLSLLALAKMSGFADVNLDPRSSDFAKMKIGNTRIDPWGGFQQLLVFLSRIATGERTDTKGKVIDISGEGKQFPFESRRDVLYRFAESKANPTIGILLDWLRGRGFTGDDLTIAGEAYSHLVPLYLQDIYDAMQKEGPAMGLMTAPGFFGYGIQTYQAKPDKTLGRKVGTSLGKKIGTPIGR